MKLIKFDLPINGTKVKNLEELRDNLTDEILALALSGQLERWLRTRQLPEQAQAVATAVLSEDTDKGLFLALCEVLEVEAHPDDVKAIFDEPPVPGRLINGSCSEMSKLLAVDEKKKFKSKIKIISYGDNFSSFDYADFIRHQVTAIVVNPGSPVVKGSLLARITRESHTTRKVAHIYSSDNGIIDLIYIKIGDYLPVGDKLFEISLFDVDQ